MNILVQILVVGLLVGLNTAYPWIQTDDDLLDSKIRKYIDVVVSERLADIRTQCQQNSENMATQGDKIASLQVEVQKLKQENDFLKVSISHLKKKFAVNKSPTSQKSDNNVLKKPETFNDQHTSLLTNANRSEETDAMNKTFDYDHQSLKEDNVESAVEPKRKIPKEKRATQPAVTKVAFSAYLTHDTADVGTGRTIVFNATRPNTDTGYSHNTGVFTCPVAGTYVFHHTMFVNAGYNYAYTEMVKNGERILQNLAAGSSANYETGSSLTIVHLAKGDEIWVRTDRHSPGVLMLSNLSTFSGFLLYEQEL